MRLSARRALVLGLLAVGVPVALPTPAGAEHSVTGLVSTGPARGSGAFDATLGKVSADGTRVVFETNETLVPADTDTSQDVYERAGGQTTLLSIGPAGGNGPFDTGAIGASADGTRVFFTTPEKLTGDDTDADRRDVYERSGGVTTLVSAGGNGPSDAFFDGASADGTRVFFTTQETLSGEDTDSGAQDVYERSGGATTLVSAGGNGPRNAFFRDASVDGTRVFFETGESHTPDDLDAEDDIYERSSGATTLVSAGGSGAFDVRFSGASTDGTRVFFDTQESHTPDDGDAKLDIYERSGGVTTLVSRGGSGASDARFRGTSADGTRVFFDTGDSLTGDDGDGGRFDAYERSGGTTTLVSVGTNAFNAFVSGASADGTHVFFGTSESLSGTDADSGRFDIYERAGGVTTLVSAGGSGAFDAFFRGASTDGTRVFFETNEPLAGSDTDAVQDLYERSGGQTTLLSTGPAGGNGPFEAFFAGASADGTRVFFTTTEPLTAEDGDAQRDIYVVRTAPDTTITAGPGALTNDPTPEFSFALSGPGVSFECRIDAGAFSPCVSPFTSAPLADGPHTFEVRAIDSRADPDPTPATIAFTVDTVPPLLTEGRVVPPRFRVGRGATPRLAARRGTSLRYRLSEPARVTIAIQRAVAGRRVRGRCVAPRRSNRRARRCTRYVAAGTITRSGPVGLNRVAFSGRIGRRALRPGRYRFSITAVDAAGNRSRTLRVAFTVVRR